jgi:hypothetical protein
MKKILSLLPTQSLINILICGAAVIAFIFLIVIPNQNLSDELEQEIEALHVRIEQQRILRPVFEGLLQRAKREQSADLPPVKIEKLDRGDFNRITKVLQEMAGRHDLKIEDIGTDVNEIMNDSGYMLMRVALSGDFMKFREFLIDMGTIPSLEQIEEIIIRAIEGNREYKLKIWLVQKTDS